MTEDELYNMSDEDLEKLVRDGGEDEIEPTNSNDEEIENDNEETEQDELDQPEEESDDDTSSDNESDDTNEGPEEDSPSEDSTEEDKELGKAKAKEDKSAEVQKYKFKANGQEFEFTEDEIKDQFGTVFAKAMDYTRKMQAIAPYRKMISAMEQEGITQDEMNLLLDARKGNKEAIQTLLNKAKVDVTDLMMDDEEEGTKEYIPNDYGLSEPELQIREVIERISSDPAFAVTERVLTSDWDESSRAELANNPVLIEKLHLDVANGVFDQVNPMAMKLKVLDGGRLPDIEYYKQAGSQYYAQLKANELAQTQSANRVAEVEKAQQQREATKKVAAKRKAAAPTKTRSGQKKSVTDYLEDTDEAFEKWYKELQERM